MHNDAQTFLMDYAQALNTHDIQQLTDFCLLPTIVMNDHHKTVFESTEQLIKACELLVEQLQAAGVVTHLPKLSQAIRLSDTLYFINMRWLLMDAKDTLIFSCPTSYTLQRAGDGSFKIIVAVMDPDPNATVGLFSSSVEVKQ